MHNEAKTIAEIAASAAGVVAITARDRYHNAVTHEDVAEDVRVAREAARRQAEQHGIDPEAVLAGIDAVFQHVLRAWPDLRPRE